MQLETKIELYTDIFTGKKIYIYSKNRTLKGGRERERERDKESARERERESRNRRTKNKTQI